MLSTFFSGHNRWGTSEFSVLPVVDPADSQALRDYCLLAGGLALVLSRCSARAVERDFKAASEAYRSLKIQLKRSRRAVRLSPRLLSELSHEIAQYADVATREAVRRCQRHNLERSARR